VQAAWSIDPQDGLNRSALPECKSAGIFHSLKYTKYTIRDADVRGRSLWGGSQSAQTLAELKR